MDSTRSCIAQLSCALNSFFHLTVQNFIVFFIRSGGVLVCRAKVSALGYILLMPKSVLLPLSFILWERLKEREMKRKTLFSISVISFKLESSNILLKIRELVNG